MDKEKKEKLKIILYKEKPIAELVGRPTPTNQGIIYTYSCICSLGKVIFVVPQHDMGETIFGDEEPAQLMSRWISTLVRI